MSDATPIQRNPYPGLRSFGADDTDVFFGRQSHVDELSSQIEVSRFLTLAGTSGSGKSSLVRAGLVPALAADGSSGAWRVVCLRPMGAPIKRLAEELSRVFPSSNILEGEIAYRDKLVASLRKDSLGLVESVKSAGRSTEERCLVVVDAFEELLYLGDSAENAAFVETLLAAAHDDSVSIHVLLIVGLDFLADCGRFKGVPEAVQEALYLLPRLSSEQIREVVEEPARVAGRPVAAELVDRLVHDAEEEDSPLPALQYVLRRLWNDSDSVNVAGYEALGGLQEAMARDADGATAELTDEERRAARKVFQVITGSVPDHHGVSRPTCLAEISLITGVPESQVRRVVEAFSAPGHELLAPGSSETLESDTLIEILHESLTRRWRTLRLWVDEERDAADAYGRVVQAASEHAEGRAGLLVGAALAFAAERIKSKEWNPRWAQHLPGNYDVAISFFEESFRASAVDPGNKTVRKALNRTRVFAGVLAVLFVGSLGLAFYAHERERTALEQQEEANRLRADALEQQDTATQGLGRAERMRGEADLQRKAALRQKEVAERQRQIAESQQRIAANQRSIAESEVVSADVRKKSDRQLLYVANMNLADRAFDEGNLVRGQEFLSAYLPTADTVENTSAANDLRSFYWYYLWRNNHQELGTLKGHGNGVSSVAFAPDGKIVATGSRDGSIKLWDPGERREIGVLEGSGNPVLSVAFAPDGRMVAAGSRDGTAQLWDTTTRKKLGTLEGKGADVFAIAFAPDGKILATGSKDGGVTLWDVETQTQLASLPGHKRDVYTVAFSSDGKTLATGSQDDTVKLWDVGSRQEVATLAGKGDDVHALTFSPDGALLATGSKDGTVKLWNVAGRKEVANLEGTGRDVYTVAFTPDGQMLAAGTRDGAIRVWNVATRKVLKTLKGHGDAVLSAAFAPQGEMLVTGSRDRTAKLWRLDTGSEQITLAGKTPIFSVAFAPQGNYLATSSVADTVSVWDLANPAQPSQLKGAGDVLFSVAFSPDGKTLATGSKDGTAKLWDVATHEEKGVLKGHGAVVFSVAFSPDGKTLATASWDRTVKLWDVATGKEAATLEGHDDSVFSVAFSPQGNVLATGGKDTTVRLWDVVTGKELAVLAGHADAVFPVAFSPDGTILASASRDGIVKLWDVATRAEIGILKGHVDSVSSVVFSPDGKTLATGSLDDTVKLWDLETRQELATLTGHTKDVYSVAFSPDGKVLASGSLDGAVKLWEATTNKEVTDQN